MCYEDAQSNRMLLKDAQSNRMCYKDAQTGSMLIIGEGIGKWMLFRSKY